MVGASSASGKHVLTAGAFYMRLGMNHDRTLSLTFQSSLDPTGAKRPNVQGSDPYASIVAATVLLVSMKHTRRP